MQQVKEAAYYHTRITDWPADERPREKLLAHGAHTLTDAELLAILVGSGTGGVTAVDVAKRLMVEYKSLGNLASKGIAELGRMKGIGNARAARVLTAFEIARRIHSDENERPDKINKPVDLVRVYGPRMRDLNNEEFRVVLLSASNRIIRDVTISKGILNASMAHPREVFKAAIDFMAASVVLIHNHPSGEAHPSPDDKRVTEQLVKAGEVMSIPVLDHLILAGETYFSFTEAGIIKR